MADAAEDDRDDRDDRDHGDAGREVKAELDERKIARGIAIGLPLATLTLGLTAGALIGPAMAILVFAAGVLLGVIALFWASLRVLSGDASLPPEIEMLDATAHAVDALASRKKMLLRAIKDLEVEHSLGKLDDDDRDQIAKMYRSELKDVMKRIDASLEPHRPKAEEAARAHLTRAGLKEPGYRGHKADEMVEKEVKSAPGRVECVKCETLNEPDAAFCKKCGGSLKAGAKADAKGDADADEEADAKGDADADEEADAKGDADADEEADAKAKAKAKETADDA